MSKERAHLKLVYGGNLSVIIYDRPKISAAITLLRFRDYTISVTEHQYLMNLLAKYIQQSSIHLVCQILLAFCVNF